MSNQFDARRRRGVLVAIVAATGVLATAITLSIGSIAQADTNAGPPDTNTRAVLAPGAPAVVPASQCNPSSPTPPPPAAAAPCATTTNGVSPGATLAGASSAAPTDYVSIHVDDGSGAGTLGGVNQTRLCRGSLTSVVLASDISPTNGDCLPASPAGFTGAEATNGNHSASASGNKYVDYTFAIGTGSYDPPGAPPVITCNSSSPCTLWIQESVTNSVDGSGSAFKHFLVTYVGTPGAPSVTSTPGNGKLTADITAPLNDGNTAAPLKYTLTVSGGDCGGATPPAGCGAQAPTTATHYVLQPLTNGQAYTVSATATSTGSNGTSTFTGPAGAAGPNASTTPVPPPSTNVTQTIYAERPSGVLVLTQVCGNSPAVPGTGTFPGQAAGAPTYTGTNPGSGGATNGSPDTLFADPDGAGPATGYPYPQDANGNVVQANYPTNCNVNLGTAHLVTSGSGAGQFFEATGALSQVTVVDARDNDPGWNAVGTMGTFHNTTLTGPKTSFGGGDLGWTPAVTSSTPQLTDADGTTYTQTVNNGVPIAPNTPDGATPPYSAATGLGSGALLAHGAAGSPTCTSVCTGGLGIARLDAALHLFIPIYARNGVYSGVLTISAF